MDAYPLYKGYLIKSPPETLLSGIKSWRKRWFVLWQNKNLEYYEDKGGEKKLIKTIDLNHCYYLDTNLSHKRFANAFSIGIKAVRDGKTSDRTYYLVAESAYEMTEWIKQICKVCDFQEIDGVIVPKQENQTTSTSTFSSEESHNDGGHRLVNNPKQVDSGKRDSGINVTQNENDHSDFAVVSPPHTPSPSTQMHESAPPYRPGSGWHGDEVSDQESEPEYQTPPTHPDNSNNSYDIVPPPVPAHTDYYATPKCLTPMSSSSEDSIRQQRSSWENASNYTPSYQSSPYDEVPPPVLKHKQRDKHSSTDSDSFCDINQPTYDVPSALQPLDDSQLYANAGALAKETEEMNTDIYDHVPSNKPLYYQTPNPSNCNFNAVSSHRERSSSDGSAAGAYDYVPAPVLKETPGIYDFVPSRNENVVFDSSEGGSYETFAPPIPPTPKPNQAYINLTYPAKDTDSYIKPLPIPPAMETSARDSGTVADFASDELYDVPPNQLRQGIFVPAVDRSSKPAVQTMDQATAPFVNRSSKPSEQNVRNYVNLPKSSTFRDFDRKEPRSHLQRSKSTVSDKQAEGYIYMENPKRTESTSRFSKKTLSCDKYDEEDDSDISYEYMDPCSGRDSSSYENFDPQDLRQSLPKPELSEKRMKGHYQDIDIVCQREAPSVPERYNANYTTIDLEKTKGLSKTISSVSKGQ